MTHSWKAFGLITTIALVLPAAAAAQGGAFAVDQAKADAGRKTWVKFGCQGCHKIGGKVGGPDLANLLDRRSVDWVTRWLKNTAQMQTTDSIGMALLKEWKGYKMPQMKVNDADIDNLLHYIQAESAKVKTKT